MSRGASWVSIGLSIGESLGCLWRVSEASLECVLSVLMVYLVVSLDVFLYLNFKFFWDIPRMSLRCL